MEWINKYIGQPWVNGEQDCWWLVRQVYKDQLGIELPQIVIDASNIRAVVNALTEHPELNEWQPIDEPEHLALCFFHRRQNPTHVAVYLDYCGGRILHTFKSGGCVMQTLHDLKMSGWTNPKYYRHK